MKKKSRAHQAPVKSFRYSPKTLAVAAGKVLQGDLDGKGLRFAIVVSRFNLFVTLKLLLGALDALACCRVPRQRVQVLWTPGAFEIPQAAKKILDAVPAQRPDAIICLGAVIRGGTPHFEYICNEAAHGIQRVALKTGIPIAFGILTTDTVKQALARAGGKSGNKGWDAAITAVEMARLFTKIGPT